LLPGTEDTAAVTAGAGPPEPAAAQAGRRNRIGIFWWVSATTVLLDQVTKAIVDASLPLYGTKTVIPRFFDLVHVRNAGVAFGLMNSLEHPWKTFITTSLALIALVSIAYYARHVRDEERFARLGLSLILGGAVGNLVDRVRQGFVIDFVDVYWRGWHFWAFNVADAAITVGAILVFIDILFLNPHASHPVSDR